MSERIDSAIAKPHNMLVMHFLIRKRSIEALGQTLTTLIEHDVIQRLKTAYADLVDGRPSR